MTSGSSHPMPTKSKPKSRRASGGRALLAVLLAAVLALVATACTTSTSDIGVGLPSAQTNTGAYLVDTLTVRTSTVLRDSVVTSGSGYLLVGRTTDPLLGTITAKSFCRLGMDAAFTPSGSFVYDSVSLVLPLITTPTAYRYGDTTKTQALVEVHRLIDPISATKPSFASTKLTKLNYDSTTVLNQGGKAPVRRARPNLTSLRLRLDDTFGRQLLAAGQAGRLTTQDEFDTYLPGLVLTPAATDNAALVLFSATVTDAALLVYYHDPTDATTVLSSSFSIYTGNRNFYQVRADRRTGGVMGLPTASLQTVDASRTAQQTFVEGALGLQTKVEIPYLTNLLDFGANATITSADFTVPVTASTLSPFVPTPPALLISTANAVNQPVATAVSGTTGTYVSSVSYLTSTSTLSGLDQGGYTWSVASYCQAVLNHVIPNNGLLVSSVSPALPSRAVLGSQRSTDKLQLRLYLIQVK
ncbi:DUF4270 family protein [Hymenobacter sp. HMF4947]|uniref:DUF4270 family protein n=1 Tax=Hymenobacter ginkgonis TaxID=2682976 RepID=A0A7K1TH36_9BACT|nr:DUF4270 family protein [Hymenobacter ginkgonis]MVN77632.1 DUF4270 family protein [Hymenobacter ginkgonis]